MSAVADLLLKSYNRFMNSKKLLEKQLRNAAEKLGFEIDPQVNFSSDLSKGDFSSNVALVAFGSMKHESRSKNKSAFELAEKMAQLLSSDNEMQEKFSKIEAAAPGFINFWLSTQSLQENLEKALSGFENKPKNREVLLEFGDPNPFKEPHIGHLRNLVLGESLARLLEFEGAKIKRLNYQGDVGLHVAKALWGLQKMSPTGSSKFQISKYETESLEQRAKLLSEAYVKGSRAFEKDKKAQKEIVSINNLIYQKESQLIEIWEKGRRWSLDYFEILYQKLGVKYDKYYFESQTAPLGFELVRKNAKIFEKDQGAWVFRGEEYGLHTRVFVTENGYSTYEAKDLALAIMKNKDFPSADMSLIMTANEQIEYFKVLLKALSLVNKKIGGKTAHISFGFVNLKEGKMSSRLGNVVSAFWLLQETQKRLKKGFKKVENSVLEDLATASVKWTMLKFSRESNMAFSLSESVQIEGNSGPYMLYAYARIHSVLSKSSKKEFEANSVKNLEAEELALTRLICQFENVVFSSVHTFSPNLLTNYLFDLAKAFNLFYEKEKIIGSPQEEKRLVLTAATGEVLKKGLDLLGIPTPEKI